MDRYQEEVRAVTSGAKSQGNLIVIAMAKKTEAEFAADVQRLREELASKAPEPGRDSLSPIFSH